MKNYFKIFGKYITDTNYRFYMNSSWGLCNHLDDETYLKRLFRARMGKELNLNNPQTFNEKLQWLKLYDRKPIYTTMVDKYAAKKYVADIIGEEYVIPTLGVWDKFEDIDFEALPDQFVLKCTHDSGGLVVCRSKSSLDKFKVKRMIERALATDYYLTGREWPYKNVPRKIIAEKYMEDNETQELRDYKFFCFNHEPKFLYISRGLEYHPTAEISFYDLTGNELPFHRSDYKPFHNAIVSDQFDNMKKIAGKCRPPIYQNRFVRNK